MVADELSTQRVSDIMLMPQCSESLGLRHLETARHVLRDCPAHPLGRRRWSERIFVICEDGVERPLSHFWGDRNPVWINRAR